jgi:glycosyltransferase involved in cell wall biosynthesis
MEMMTSRKTIEEIGFRHCDALTLVSRFDEGFAQARGYKERDRMLVIENPLETEWIGQQVDFAREPIVGFVGSWIERKGSDILPEIMTRVLGEVPDCKFLVIGIGEAASLQLRRAFPAEKRVEIIPFCPRPELLNHYRRIAVLLAPGVYESFGLTFAEAMSSGVALLATPVGFAAGLNDGKECLIISDCSPVGIAAQLSYIMKNPHHCQTIARAGFERVQSLRWDFAMNKIIAFYDGLIHAVRGRN